MNRAADTVAERKAEIRRIARRRRTEFPEADRIEADQKICRRVVELADLRKAFTIHLYWPIVARLEVDIRPAIAELRRLDKRVLLPLIDSPDERTMTQRSFEGEGLLTAGPFNTLEPSSGKLIPLSETELVVAPALAADRRGARVGYGGGFYDRFLRSAVCPVATVVYSNCLFDDIPVHTHDVSVDFVITELETIATDRSAT